MKNRRLRPLALVHVVGIFWKPRKIDDSEVRANRRPWIRCRLTDVVPARPDEQTRHEVVLLHQLPGLFMSCSPRRTTVVVCRAGKIFVAVHQRLVPLGRPATNYFR